MPGGRVVRALAATHDVIWLADIYGVNFGYRKVRCLVFLRWAYLFGGSKGRATNRVARFWNPLDSRDGGQKPGGHGFLAPREHPEAECCHRHHEYLSPRARRHHGSAEVAGGTGRRPFSAGAWRLTQTPGRGSTWP